MITPEDYQIVLKLESNPLISYSDLADELGVSWPTAKRKLNDLKSRGVIRTPVALYNIKALGLQRITVIWSLESIENLTLMEKLCDLHPYTHYRVRGYGDGFVLFAQFDIPPETISLMKELIDTLEQENYVSVTEILQSSGYQIEVFPDLNFYDLQHNKWHFNWNEWLSLIEDQPENLPKPEPQKIGLEEWKLIDFKILRELTKNPEIKQAELMRLLDLTRTNVHLKYNLVFENLISSVRSRYDRILFNLVNTRLFWVSNEDKKRIHQFFNLINEAPPPFRFGMDILKDNGFVFWGGALPSFHEHQLAFSIWKLFQSFATYTLDTSADTSMIYWFYPENFDFNTHYWKIDREYVLEYPLEELRQV
ncbi:MAG: winged helix-turn-helix transcriptional regulator [Candidatus Heimdallarchaeota archaeon]|nr:MAG: winged helix-turn-helix transcriptional regulator [Candidatus Heimdallarchaeota archaeon]